jgi:excisionase family DNA binding protein
VSNRPFSPETLASHWGCSAEKIRIMCKRGELASFRLGKLIRIPAAEVERYECQNTDLESTEGDGRSSTAADETASVSRLARLTVVSRKLALATSGGASTRPQASE